MDAPGRPAAVVVVGDLMADVVARLDGPLHLGSDAAASITAVPGGSAANTAAWLADAGVAPVLVGSVGDDGPGREQLEDLRRRGVELRVAVIPGVGTGSVVALVDPSGERSFVTARGANSHLDARNADALIRPASHLHLSGYALLDPVSRPAALRFLSSARAVSATVSVDAASTEPLRRADVGAWLRWTAGADLLFANLGEGRAVTGLSAPDEVAASLAEHYDEVVLKLGAEGCLWASGSRALCVAADAGVVVVDTVGAGDALAAGFLASWLRGVGTEDSLHAGVAAAGRAVGRLGGRPAAVRPPRYRAAAMTPDPDWPQLREEARRVAARAHAPYSGLLVGAAGLASDGRIVSGCNVESASYGLTLCAECGLVSALHATGCKRLLAVAVVAADGDPLVPCGRCRQILMDHGGPDLLVDAGGASPPHRLADLLPGAFDDAELARRRREGRPA